LAWAAIVDHVSVAGSQISTGRTAFWSLYPSELVRPPVAITLPSGKFVSVW
jgi:hypothetical protein